MPAFAGMTKGLWMNNDDHHAEMLDRFRSMSRPMRFIRSRVRLWISIAAGIVAMAILPTDWRPISRALIAWDVVATLYLILAYAMVWQTKPSIIRRHALIQDDGRFAILIVTAIAALASLGAIMAEIGAAGRTPLQIAFAVITVALSWVMVHTIFALHYAHEYYRKQEAGSGLNFPGDDKPDYWDFAYFAFVIGMTAQTSDTAITDRGIRRTALAHGIVSFIFNTALLALMVNIAASAI
jgi:uncharacterized membrane protein